MQHAFPDVRDVWRTDSHLRACIRELLKPQRNVPDDILVRAFLGMLVDTIEVVLQLCAVDGYADREVAHVLLDEVLHLLAVVVDAVRGEREAIGVEPMMIPAKHLSLQVIAYPVYQFNLKERLAPDEVPHHTLFLELILAVKDIVNGFFRHIPRFQGSFCSFTIFKWVLKLIHHHHKTSTYT